MSAKPDFNQIQEYILKQLPQLLRQNPEIALTIEGMLAHQFPRRDEFARLLEEVTHLWQELKLHREDTNDRFERLWQELKLLREDTSSRFEQVWQELKLLREDTNRRFEQVDKRMDQIDKRMDQIDKRMGQIDKRMDQIDKRMDQIEKRIDQVEQRLDLLNKEVNQLRDDMNQRFDQIQQEMDRRFEQMQQEMDRRFEQMQEKMDRRFEQMQQEMDRRFDLMQKEMDRRFEEEKRERKDMMRRIIKVESAVERMDKKITQFDAWLNVVTGNVGEKRGQEAEQLFALGLGYGLKRADIKPETIQLRQMFMDAEGIVFPKKGKYIEVDILAENGKLSVFEVKITAVDTDVVTFARKVQLVQHQNPEKPVNGIFISPNASEEVKQCCAEYDLAFVG
jgi:chromosome segregation ATPase